MTVPPSNTPQDRAREAADDALPPDDPARIVSLVDLTSLDESDTDATIDALLERAVTPLGPVAAVCVLPRFVSRCVERLAGTGVRVATVANFPGGEADVEGAVRTTQAAVDEGADEVDVVAPWRAFLDGDHRTFAELVGGCAAECEALKVILETGSHPDLDATRAMAQAAMDHGAAFLKTSTGKSGPGASLDATRVLLEVAGAQAGVKASGGIRTRADAAAYVALADEVGGGWGGRAEPGTFRIGASSLLDDLL